MIKVLRAYKDSNRAVIITPTLPQSETVGTIQVQDYIGDIKRKLFSEYRKQKATPTPRE
jgi:hypothetical protein